MTAWPPSKEKEKTMTSKPKPKTNKPIWEKWWFWIIIILVVAAIGGTNGNNGSTQSTSSSPSGVATKPNVMPKKETKGKAEGGKSALAKKSPLKQFEESFNSQSATPISDASSFVVQDRNSGHYRAEYRLDAYSDAIGEHGKIGDISIDMVQYRDDMFRFYATGPRDSVLAAYPALAKSMDPSLSDADIQAVVDKCLQGYAANDLSFAGSAKRIESNDFTFQDGNFEAFIDADFSK